MPSSTDKAAARKLTEPFEVRPQDGSILISGVGFEISMTPEAAAKSAALLLAAAEQAMPGPAGEPREQSAAESAMAANARSRKRQGRTEDQERREAADKD